MQKPILSSTSCSLDTWVRKKAHPRSCGGAWGFGTADGHRNLPALPTCFVHRASAPPTAMGWRHTLSLGLLIFSACCCKGRGRVQCTETH